MNFFYNSFALHNLGEVTITQTREVEDGQRVKVSLKVGVSLFERSYGDNYALLIQLREALKTQEAVFQWTNTDTGTDYVNQTVTLVSEDLPEEWGEYYQAANLVFFYYEQNLATNNMPLVFTRSAVGQPLIALEGLPDDGSGIGGPGSVRLGNVTKFKDTTSTERFSPFHAARSLVKGKVAASGLLLVDTTAPLNARRGLLITLAAGLEQLKSAEGRLSFGNVPPAFNRLVRVEDIEVEIDQLHYAIAWSFTASYTVFPNEETFATVEYTVDQRDENTGEQFLRVSGKISAALEATARAKLAALLPAVQAQYGYALILPPVPVQELRADTSAKQVMANEDGDIFIELTFTSEWRRFRPENQMATFQKTAPASGGAIGLGNVVNWDLEYSARRFNDQHSQRQHAGGRIAATGTWVAGGSLSLTARRTALLAAQRAMLTEVNGADGTLKYGDFSQVVRVENLTAKINQAMTGIDWTMTASYSLFPDESGYATVEFSVAQRSDVESGEETLAFSGRILAPDEALARAKLATVRTTMLGLYTYTAAQQIKAESTAASVSANGDKTAGAAAHEWADGTTFIELSFGEEYRRRAASLIGWSLQCVSRDDQATGFVLTTFSGWVTASGATADAAYVTAGAKAAVLGSGKEAVIGGSAFQKTSQITWEQRQTQASNAVEFVRLTFSYEYQGRMAAGRSYLEVNTELAVETFGTDTRSVSGFVVAASAALCASIYAAQVRAGYGAGIVVHSERTAASVIKAEAPAGYITQETRLEFSFSVFVPKAAAKQAYRYGVTVSSDYLALEQTTHLRGSVFTSTEAIAATLVDGLQTTIMGSVKPTRSERNVDREYSQDVSAGGALGLYLKYDFDATFVTRITGQTGLLEMSVSEKVQYSGVRWVVQPVPRNDDGTGGISIPQDAGEQEGSRTVRGSATAADKATAENWCKQQRALLTGLYKLPEEFETEYKFVPRVDGVLSGVGANVQVFRVSFTFSEILVNLRAS